MKKRNQPLGNNNIIGKYVTQLRKQKKMTQKELAAQMQLRGVDINPSSLSKLEGQTRIATDREVQVIAEIFKISADELLNGSKIQTDLQGHGKNGADLWSE